MWWAGVGWVGSGRWWGRADGQATRSEAGGGGRRDSWVGGDDEQRAQRRVPWWWWRRRVFWDQGKTSPRPLSAGGGPAVSGLGAHGRDCSGQARPRQRPDGSGRYQAPERASRAKRAPATTLTLEQDSGLRHIGPSPNPLLPNTQHLCVCPDASSPGPLARSCCLACFSGRGRAPAPPTRPLSPWFRRPSPTPALLPPSPTPLESTARL